VIAGADGARRRDQGRARSRDVRGASRRFDEALVAARREGKGARAEPAGACAKRRAAPERRGGPEVALRGRSEADGAGASPQSGTAPTAPTDVAAWPQVAALRAAVRALPAAIEAARLQGNAQITLTLGGALGVDLRGRADGVELTLRPDAALGRAAAAELPALVAALRARGVRVVGAEVRTTPGARRSPGPPARQAR
jgi:hypothetical protein